MTYRLTRQPTKEEARTAFRCPQQETNSRGLPLDDLTLQLDYLGFLPAIRILSQLGSRCQALKQRKHYNPADYDHHASVSPHLLDK